jgi:hypothetical protein
MLQKVWDLLVKYSVRKVLIDCANPSFIKSLKIEWVRDQTMKTRRALQIHEGSTGFIWQRTQRNVRTLQNATRARIYSNQS